MSNSSENKKKDKKSLDFLPSYFRTPKNSKFLSSTLDQVIKEPKIKRLDGYIGSRSVVNYDINKDQYVSKDNSLQSKYQLEPGLIVKNNQENIKKIFSIDDYINYLTINGLNPNKLNNFISPKICSYDPPIDWDKFVNFSEYYWLSNGPQSVLIEDVVGEPTTSTYTVTDSQEGNSFVFTPDGLTPNPVLTLYKGNTYIFNVTALSKFYIKNSNTTGISDLYTSGISGQGTGQIIFTVPNNAPKNLYYTSDTNQFANGKIVVKKRSEKKSINVEEEILGKKFYTSSNNVKLMNGLKIKFLDNVLPKYYRNKEFYVEGVGDKIVLINVADLQTPELPTSISVSDVNVGTEIVDKQYYSNFVNGIRVRFTSNIIPSFYKDKEFYVSGVGTGIQLTPAGIIPQPIAELINKPFDGSNFDQFPFDAFKNIPITPEYVTINRASKDLNPWSRYNRWFHRSVIEFSQTFNKSKINLDSNFKARRPIIEFEKNIQLYNFGNEFIGNIGLLDSKETDAFSNIEGAEEYYIDGIKLQEGFTVLFTADLDLLVRSKIYKVSFAYTSDNKRRINLVPYDVVPDVNSTVIINNGYTQAGSQWWFNGNTWQLSQNRSSRNQSPLFDLYNSQGQSYSDNQITTFQGNKIFGYKIGSGVNDPILGFPLVYDSLSITGAYQFQNYFVTESFFDSITTQTKTVDTYTLFYKLNNDQGVYKNVWTEPQSFLIPVLQENILENSDAVEINSVVAPLELNDSNVLVFINDVKTDAYSILSNTNKKIIKFNDPISGVVKLKIKTLQEITANGYYETPINLTNNPYNFLINDFTYTEIFDHVQSMIENSKDFQGVFPGQSNLNEIKNISNFGNRIIINSTPLTFAHHFLTDVDNNLIDSLTMASENYNQVKSAIIKESISISENISPSDALDEIISKLNLNKDSSFPYANSDMIAYGKNYKINTIRVTDTLNKYYPISSVFNLSTLSSKSILVYLNDEQLIYGKDYIFDDVDPYVIIETALSRNDIIKIKEYADTYGSYIAPTPSKLGLYPKYYPVIYIDDTFASGPVEMIQGHDGSITKSFGDYRDQIILEFERRIFNNIKTKFNEDLIRCLSIFPGNFRSSNFSLAELNNVIYSNFIKWSETYVLDFESNNTFIDANSRTYNYKSINQEIPGNWKGIYRYYFDTIRPHSHPWEMLGFSIKPSWWENEYGPLPYTSNNLILWKHIEDGYIAQGERKGINLNYARPGLISILPVNDHGDLIDIAEWYTKLTNSTLNNVNDNWVFGDHGPVEESWRRSSHWPFVVQKILALFDSAGYSVYAANFGSIIKNISNQYIFDSKKYINTLDLAEYLTTNKPIAGYVEYVLEYGKLKSKNYFSNLINDLKFSDVNLIYKIGGFISKDKTQIIIDSVSPNTINPGFLLPQEDFTIELNSGNLVDRVAISGIIIRKSKNSFVISGYDRTNPYFTIFPPMYQSTDPILSVGGKSDSYLTWTQNSFYAQGQLVKYQENFYRVLISHTSNIFESKYFRKLANLPQIGGASVQKAVRFENVSKNIHYGTVCHNIQDVYNIIVGYGKWLESQGFVFDSYNSDLQQVINWNFSAKEFLYWSTQNWTSGTAISLSPFADKLKFVKNDFFVNNLLDLRYNHGVLGIDGKALSKDYFSVTREEGSCEIISKDSNTGIFFVKLNLVQKEHILKLNNISIFNDKIYDIETGYRQKRIKLLGFKTDDWNGDYFSPGFLYDSVVVQDWESYKEYQIGDVVKYSNNFYSATKNISGTKSFNLEDWDYLPQKPENNLLPNFDYKISQFEDFYSLDIDNIDLSQQNLAQGLIGFDSQNYLSNLILNNISRYKFYQGFIKEKGTKNAIEKISKIDINSFKGNIEYNEEWAFRTGTYGGYSSLREIEFPLREIDFKENNQVVVLNNIADKTNVNYSYIDRSHLSLYSEDFDLNNLFELAPYDKTGHDFKYSVAGYVRLDDVNATAVNKSQLLNISNNNLIIEGDKIWLCFDDNRDWNIYRYSKTPINIISSQLIVEDSSILIETDVLHNFSVNDLVSIDNYNNDVDGIYVITGVPQLNQFTINSSLTSLSNEFNTGVIFTFESFRFNSFDALAQYKNQYNIKDNEIIWVDNQNEKWSVFKKYNNVDYVSTLTGNTAVINQDFGSTVKAFTNTNYVFVASLEYSDGISNLGRVFVKEKINSDINSVTSIGLNKSPDTYTVYSGNTSFGKSIEFDRNNNVIFVGAPLVGNIKADTTGDVRYARPSNTVVNSTATGLVKISLLNKSFTPAREIEKAVLVSQVPQNFAEFGHSIFLTKDATVNKLLVGAPGQNSIGAVFVYNYTVDSQTNITLTSSQIISNPPGNLRFGSKISGSLDGKYIAISCQSDYSNFGAVYIYELVNNSYVLLQSIIDGSQYVPNYVKLGNLFAEDIHMSGNGQYLFIAASNVEDYNYGFGKIFVYKKTQNQYLLVQIINNVEGIDLKFGHRVTSNYQGDVILASSIGTNFYNDVIFDNNQVIFDSNSTIFGNVYQNSGATYVFNRYNNHFVFAKEIFDSSVSTDSQYGESIDIGDSYFIVGSPNNINLNASYGTAYVFNTDTLGLKSWQLFRSQEDVADISKIKNAKLIDLEQESVVEPLEILDPLKGKIIGIADQELAYKTIYDPAIYNIGNNTVSVDVYNSWLDLQVGQLWWDLSSVKFIWYEQGDLDYRKSTWGSVFPGTSIDVYEWVRSEFKPSQWAALADTVQGLRLGISGQPKYLDDNVLCLSQYYNPISEKYTDIYYFWIKNSKLVPNVKNRRISSYEVSQLILNPKTLNQSYLSIISKNAVLLTNVKPKLKENIINLNIIFDKISNPIEKHSEWILLEQGSAKSQPPVSLENKLIESLLGRDQLGNIVPDPTLPDRMKYGIEVRPKQSMFKYKNLALRNLIEYSNFIFRKYPISMLRSFNSLFNKDPLPDPYLGAYDYIIQNNILLDQIFALDYIPAQLVGNINTSTGLLTSVSIVNGGSGYGKIIPTEYQFIGNVIDDNKTPVKWIGPSVEVENISTAKIQTIVDSNGTIIEVEILDPGVAISNVSTVNITVRPLTTVVINDETSSNRWSKYIKSNNTWLKILVQKYNTELYWNYINWEDESYNALQPYSITLNNIYDLSSVDTAVNSYVKINDYGDGSSIILKKVVSDGTFNKDYDIVFKENGTIQLSDNLWNYENSSFGFDQNAPYDNTLYDQTPDIELENILKSIKNELFADDFKVYWNEFFFAAVKYAFSEQKFLDWAFKTSFISIKNYAGNLSQRKVYKLQNSSYLEKYIQEIKPYKTNIRNYITSYDNVENSYTYNNDFDYPAVFNQETNSFDTLDISAVNGQYPWQDWKDNFTYQVDRIEILFQGSGYRLPPEIEIIPAAGDTIIRPTIAKAYVSNGKIYFIEILDKGLGYTKTPKIIIKGGGSTDITPAILYPVLYNGKVRSNLVKIKFDRISDSKLINDKSVTDQFITNGNIKSFDLSWAADLDYNSIKVYFNNIKLLNSEYKIENYRKDYIDPIQIGTTYKKLYSKLTINDNILPITTASIIADTTENVSLGDDIIYVTQTDNILPNFKISIDGSSIGNTQVEEILKVGHRSAIRVSPKINSLITKGTRLAFISTATNLYSEVSIKYNKNIELYSAVDRIVDYYSPKSGMPGNDLDQLMSGISFPGTEIKTLPFNYTSNWDMLPFDSVFWQDTDSSKKLETVIDGGNLSYSTALGINPEDIIVSGDKFLSAAHGHAPEELMAGEIHDSLGINVYTRNLFGGGYIYHQIFDVVASSSPSTYQLRHSPVSLGGVFVSYNGVVQEYQTDFTIDFENATITLSPKNQTGRLFISIMDPGGLEYLGDDSVTVSNTSSAKLISDVRYTDIGGAFVTVNGQVINTAISTTTSYYSLSAASSNNNRGAVNVFNLSTNTNTISAWFFRSDNFNFTNIYEQIFNIDDITINQEGGFLLNNPPNNLESPSSQAIVEVEDLNFVYRRLTPPNTTYYTVKNNQRVFKIDPTGQYNSNVFDLSRLEVYKNGVRAVSGIEFILDSQNDTIIFDTDILTDGDNISITILIDCDYFIINGRLYVNFTRIRQTFQITENRSVRISTFSNHDYNVMRQEVFDMTQVGIYQISRAVINDNYVWVSADRKILANRTDFSIKNSNIIQFEPHIEYVPGAQVVITSFSKFRATTAIAYRIFKDMLGRNHFKRLADNFTTVLSHPLNINDTEIHVTNADVLSAPNPANNIPGIILIGGERIEYMAKDSNKLSRITRATLGTGAKQSYSIGTKVFDQGTRQTIPFEEITDVKTFTSTNTTTYVITDITFNQGSQPHDQVEVYFGGKLLLKPLPATSLRLKHDTTSTYDSGENRTYIEIDPEFQLTAITTNSTAVLELNIDYLTEDKRITVVKKNSTHWYQTGIGLPTNGVSLLTTDSIQAEFLRNHTASLPDKYYYGT